MSLEEKAALLKVSDEEQFLAGLIAAGGYKFGRTASTVVKRQNGNVLDALDFPKYFIWVTDFEAKRFQNWFAVLFALSDILTPYAWSKIDALTVYGTVHPLPTSGNDVEVQYLLKTFGVMRSTVTLAKQRDANGNIVCYFER